MLSSEELESIAKFRRLSMQNAERAYLQDIALFSIYSRAGRELVFKGGTCLFKVYGINRFSEDLDFTFNGKRELDKVVEGIPRDMSLINIRATIKDTKEYRNQLNARILINGPLYRGTKAAQCSIPLNISMKEMTILEPGQARITPMHAEIPQFDIFAMQEKEILAEKIRAILTREKPRDIYDLWYLLKTKNVNPDFEMINKKLRLYNLSFDNALFKEAVSRKEKLWETDLKGLMLGNLPPFKSISREVVEMLGH